MDGTEFAAARPADYLRRVADSAAGQAYKPLALDELRIAAGQTVVDLGCGPGTDLSDFAAAAGPDGAVIGVDHDADAVTAATEAVRTLPWVQVVAADIHDTGLPGGGADRVHADRVLQHVTDPAAAIREANRLLRPGGRAVFAEPDYDTLIVDYPDPRVPRAYRSFITDRVVRNATIGRQLQRLAGHAGFSVVTAIPVTSVFTDVREADEVFGFARVTRRAVAAGYLEDQEAADWLAQLAAGPFFASCTLFVVVADAWAAPDVRGGAG